jgi:hypothetical protein
MAHKRKNGTHHEILQTGKSQTLYLIDNSCGLASTMTVYLVSGAQSTFQQQQNGA